MIEELNKGKMKRCDLTENGRQTGNNMPGCSTDPEKGTMENPERDLRNDLTNLTSQVQMMSDSLAACKQLSKYRPLRKTYDGGARKTPRKTLPETTEKSHQSSTSSKESTRPSSAVEKDVIVSYMIDKNKKSKKPYGSLPCRDLSDDRCGRNFQRLDLVSPNDFRKSLGHKTEDADPERMFALIQSELKMLMRLAPAASLLIVTLSDRIFRYKERSRCSRKLSTSLPWILNRIQELIKYVADKRGIFYNWASVESIRSNSAPQESEKEDKKSELSFAQEEWPREIGKLEKVDAADAVAATPGVQIVLEVKPQQQKKRFFDKAGLRLLEGGDVTFPVVHLNHPAHVPVVHVVKPSPKPEVSGKRKSEIVFLKNTDSSILAVLRFPSLCLVSLLLSCPVSRTLISRGILYLNPVPVLEELVLKLGQHFLTVFTTKLEYIAEPKIVTIKKSPIFRPNVRKSYGIHKFLAEAPDLVKELLREAEEEKMEVRKLQRKVQDVKDLMADVHRNQIELSHVLLQKGIFSEVLIRYTDPNLLEEENQLMKSLEEIDQAFSGQTAVSVESLKETIRELMDKCTLKNNTLKALTEGLTQSNIPKDCWEEILGENLNDERPIGEFDSVKVVQLIQTLSLFFANGEKASRLPPMSPRIEEQPAEEEPIMKGKVGANIEQYLENLSRHRGKMAASWNFDEFEDCRPPMRILAFPATNFPDGIDASVRKMENQISLLNIENEKLWHEVYELRNQLKISRDELIERRMRSNSTDSSKPKRTINLTIQISPPKVSEIVRTKDTSDDGEPTEESGKSRALGVRPKFHTKRQTSQNDLNTLDDITGPKMKKQLSDVSVQQIMVVTPQPSGYIFRIPSNGTAGPSAKQVDHSLQRPSVTEFLERQSFDMHATKNERELQPIMENDNSGLTSSEAVSQTIQKLRTRVRSIHKEITILKLKNDRIDKLLDRIVDDSEENNRSIEDMRNNLDDFNRRLS